MMRFTSYSLMRKGKLWMCLIIFQLFCGLNYAQEEVSIDSLERLYKSKSLTAEERLHLLQQISGETTDPTEKLNYSEELIELATKLDSSRYIFSGLFQKGNAYRVKGDLSKALQNYFQAAQLASESNDQRSLGMTNLTIGDIYSLMNNHNRATEYYSEAISTFRKINDSTLLAPSLFNLGDHYLKRNKPDSALVYFQESQDIYQRLKDEAGMAYNMGSIGVLYAGRGEYDKAENNIYQAVQILEKEDEFPAISEYLNDMSEVYINKGNLDKAIDFSLMSLDIAETYGFKNEISEAALQLSKLYEKKGDIPRSYDYYKKYINFRDQVNNVASAQEIAGLRADYEVSQKQMEIDLLNAKDKNQKLAVISIGAASVLIALLAFGLYRRNRFIKRTSNIIEKERDRSDHLLLNILPEQTAMELKDNGKVTAKRFECVTVLFADFREFTQYSEKLTPEELIETIDFYFSEFDEIVEKYGVEKIKTIGDSYMAASGLPFPVEDHAERMINAAMEMSRFVEDSKNNTRNKAHFDVRIGIHSGPVVAGVVGTKKFAYDIWGDTVNVAARMEENCESGKINISESTCELLQDSFHCEYRGEIPAKHKGTLKMYYVKEKIAVAANS